MDHHGGNGGPDERTVRGGAVADLRGAAEPRALDAKADDAEELAPEARGS